MLVKLPENGIGSGDISNIVSFSSTGTHRTSLPDTSLKFPNWDVLFPPVCACTAQREKAKPSTSRGVIIFAFINFPPICELDLLHLLHKLN